MTATVHTKEWTCYYLHYNQGPDVYLFGRCLHTNLIYVSLGRCSPHWEICLPFNEFKRCKILYCYYILSKLLTIGQGRSRLETRIEQKYATFRLTPTEKNLPVLIGRVDWKQLYILPYSEPLVRLPLQQYHHNLTPHSYTKIKSSLKYFRYNSDIPMKDMAYLKEHTLFQVISHLHEEIHHAERQIYSDPLLIAQKIAILLKKYPLCEDILSILYKHKLG